MDPLDFDLGDAGAVGDVVDDVSDLRDVADLDIDLGPAADVVSATRDAVDAANFFDLGPMVDVAGQPHDDGSVSLDFDLGPAGCVGPDPEPVEHSPPELLPWQKAWNSQVRREGDQVGQGAGQIHANTYRIDGMVREAFSFRQRPGDHKMGEVSIDSSHRELETMCSIAALTQKAFVAQAVNRVELLDALGPSVAFIQRSFDSTPSFHCFGSFPHLAKRARYVREIPAGTNGCQYARFTTQSYEDLVASEEANGRRRTRLPQRGILEILSRRSEVTWASVEDYQPQSWLCLYPPSVIEDTSCATLANALEQDSQLDSLAGLDSADIVVLDDMGDGHKSNVRYFKSQRDLLAPANFMWYNEHSKCGAHLLHNAIVKESKEDRIVGHVHAVFTVLTVDARRDSLIRTFRGVVTQELDVIHGDAPHVFKQHNAAIVEQTLLRTDALIKSRKGRDAPHAPPSSLEQHQQPYPVTGFARRQGRRRRPRHSTRVEAARRFCIMVNGDTTSGRCQHFENGCCVTESGEPATREVIVENFITACVEAGFFGHRDSRAPAKNRWLTTAACLGLISLGMIVHRILPRVWMLTFPKYEIPRGQTDVDDFHRLIRAKIWRAKIWLDHPDACMRSLVTCITSAPVEHLLMVLQRIDDQGGAILQLTHPKDSPVLDCLGQIARHLLEPREGPLSVPLHHYLARGVDAAVVCMQLLVRFSLGFAGRVWRLHRRWAWFPYLLARLIAPDASEEEKRDVAFLLFSVPACCIDCAFSLKVRLMAGSAAELLQNKAVLTAIRIWAERSRVANMHMERLIALHQKAAPARCDVTRALSGGFLSQVLAVHGTAGGRYSFGLKRSDLIAAGVPVRAHGLSAAGKQQRAARVREAVSAHRCALSEGKDLAQLRGHYKFWANAQQRRAKRRSGPCSREEYRLRCDRLHARWASGEDLSDVEDSDDDMVDASERYEKNIGQRLFGLSSRDWPVLPSRLAAQADIEAPPTNTIGGGVGVRGVGFTDRLHDVRQSYLAGLFHGPRDSKVPIKQKLAAEVVCRHVDPGCCRRSHPAALKRAHQDLARCLEKQATGTLFELFAAYEITDGIPSNDRSASRMFAKAVQDRDELTLVQVKRKDNGAPYFVQGGPEGFAFQSGEMALSEFWSCPDAPPMTLQLRLFESGCVRLTPLDMEDPLPRKIEMVKAIELSVDTSPMEGAERTLEVPAQARSELSDDEDGPELLEDEAQAFEMETSLVGGLKKLKSRRAAAKVRAKTRARCHRAQANSHGKRKQERVQRPAEETSGNVAEAVPYIVAHRRAEKFPTIAVGDDGSYIRLSTNSDGSCDMRAVCAQHSIGKGHMECNLSRTCRVGRGANLGRPLGLLCWFLEKGSDPDIADKARFFNAKADVCLHIYTYMCEGIPQRFGAVFDQRGAAHCPSQFCGQVLLGRRRRGCCPRRCQDFRWAGQSLVAS